MTAIAAASRNNIGLTILLSALVISGGCGGSGGTPPTSPPSSEIGAMTVGPLQVRTADAANLRIENLPSPGQCAVTAIHGAHIAYLASTALLDRVVFSSDRSGNWQIYTCNLDGSDLQRLTTGGDDDWYPTWSPDGTRIAFSRSSPGQGERICIMNADGSGVRALTSSGAVCTDPDFSPNGRRIAFRSNRDGNQEIWVMYADGTVQRNLSDSPGSGEWDPAWSPDGTALAFVSDRSGSHEIYTMDVQGQAVERLTDDGYADSYPAWSPCGGMLAYQSFRGGVCEVMLMQSGGGGQRNFSASAHFDGLPRFSGDGRLMAFTSGRAGNYDIWLQELGDLQRAWPVTSHSAADDFADLGSPRVQPERVLIGPAGADRGYNPIWNGAPAVVAAFDGHGYRNLVRIGIAPEHLASLSIEPLDDTGGQLVGLRVSAERVANLRQDAGLGQPPTVWHLSAYGAETVLLYMNADSGRLVSALVVSPTAYPAAALESGQRAQAWSASAEGDAVRLSGRWAAVFDADGRNVAPDGAAQVQVAAQGPMEIRK